LGDRPSPDSIADADRLRDNPHPFVDADPFPHAIE
jgi:hypothetical protein